MQSSTYTNIKTKTKFNVQALHKITTKQSVLRMSNAVCIQNLAMKNSLFVPSKLEPLGLDNSIKINHNLKLIRYKKQLQPHKCKISSSPLGKSMSSLINETNDFKQLRHKRNISAVWQTKKLNKQRQKRAQKLDKQKGQPPTASFYLKKGDAPIFYQLKMEIKKVQSNLRPIEKVFKNKYRNRNFISSQKPQQKQTTQKTLPNQSTQIKQIAKTSSQLKQYTQTQKKFITAQKYSIPFKPQTYKQRFIKSTLISYSSKTNISNNNNKSKQTIDIIPDLIHIKNLLSQSNQISQQNIELVQNQIYFIANYQQNKQQLNTKTANCISVCHFNHLTQALTPLLMKQPNKRVQIASITKIMTCFLILNIAKFFNLNINKQKVLVSQKASKMPGTSAGLAYSDTLTVYQLLHALMLPSGNDAAVSLAEWGGKTIRKYCAIAQKYRMSKTVDTKSMNFIIDYAVQKKTYQKLFVLYMNRAANTLKLRNTKFVNSHGLMNQKAYSTSLDVAVLTCIAIKNQIFAQIVGKKYFQCKVFNRTYSQYTNISWKNTNRLLNTEGFIGVKTGVTPSAGPCLSSMFSINQKQSIVIVVLRTRSMDTRFTQSLELLKQALIKLGVGTIDYLMNKITQDDQSTAISMQNDKGQYANLIQDQLQLNSDRQVQQDEQFEE